MNLGNGTSTYILSGWKEIAKYLGKGVRTVQRYEGDLRLPVRRPAGRARGSVVATKAELDAWVSASPIREEFQPTLKADPCCAVSMAAVRQGISEMRVLREQMRGLRVEMRISISLLAERVQVLRGEVEEKEQHPTPVCDILGPMAGSKDVLGLLGDLTLQKAS